MRWLTKLTVVFDSTPAKDLKIDPAPDEDHPFEVPKVHKTMTRLATHKAGRQAVQQKVFRRSGRVCPLGETTVAPMIEAAHVVDMQFDGTNDARN
jgi:hypothetical protein